MLYLYMSVINNSQRMVTTKSPNNMKFLALAQIIVIAAANEWTREKDTLSFDSYKEDLRFANETKKLNNFEYVTIMDDSAVPMADSEDDTKFSINAYINLIIKKLKCRALFPGDIPLLNRKILNGARVSIKEHPYMVSIRRQMSHFLTGTLLSRNIIISVAHPLVGVPIVELTAIAGENYADRGSTQMTVILIVFHQNFDPFTLRADLALLRVYETLIVKTSVKPVAGLTFPQFDVFGTTGFVSGWGRCDTTGEELCLPRSSIFYPDEYFDPMLRTIQLNIQNNTELLLGCTSYKRLYDLNIVEGMICLGNTRSLNTGSPCLAVPGAPLVIRGLLAGILSWGMGCGDKHDLPLIFTDIRQYYGWIEHNVLVLNEQNYRALYRATKALKYHRWLTRSHKDMEVVNPKDELIIHDLDKVLAQVNGTIIDIRNFVHNGLYKDAKQRLYERFRSSQERYEYLVTEMITTLTSFPFLLLKYLDESVSYEDYGSLGMVHSDENDEDNIYLQTNHNHI